MPKSQFRPPPIRVEDCETVPQPALAENPNTSNTSNTQIPLDEAVGPQLPQAPQAPEAPEASEAAQTGCDTPTNLGTYDQSQRLYEALGSPPVQPLLPPPGIQLALQNVQQNVQPQLALVTLVTPLVALPDIDELPEAGSSPGSSMATASSASSASSSSAASSNVASSGLNAGAAKFRPNMEVGSDICGVCGIG